MASAARQVKLIVPREARLDKLSDAVPGLGDATLVGEDPLRATEKPSRRMAFPRDGQSLASLKSPVSSMEHRDFGIPAGAESLLDLLSSTGTSYYDGPRIRGLIRRWRPPKVQSSCRFPEAMDSALYAQVAGAGPSDSRRVAASQFLKSIKVLYFWQRGQ